MGGRNYDSLGNYNSYSLAWLGPILYPLALAVGFQAYTYYSMGRDASYRGPLDWLARKVTKLIDTPPPDSRVTATTLLVMIPESLFAVFCIVQCIVNFSSTSFSGGARYCDLQAFYATYYTLASVGTFAMAMLVGARIATNNEPSLTLVAAIGAGVHAVAIIVGLLPVMGAGEYLFATDYCQYNVESGLFSGLIFTWLLAGLAVVVASTVVVWQHADITGGVNEPMCGGETDEGETGASLKRLYLGSAIYYAVSWLTTFVIIGLYWANGDVFSSSQWRVYGAQALILHSNQLIVPLFIALWWRHLMNAIIAARQEAQKAADVSSPEA